MLPEFGRHAKAISLGRKQEHRVAEPRAVVLVLGAGMVGVSAALHLQRLGRDVILADRHGRAGEETSYGNAGLIECASVFPYMFPRDFKQIFQYALNRSPQVRYSVSDLPDFLPWLVRYYLASSPARAMHSAMAELPLIQRSLIEHEALIAEAGSRICCVASAGSNCFAPRQALPTLCAMPNGPNNTAFPARCSTTSRSLRASPV
jgi:hypothetical protein